MDLVCAKLCELKQQNLSHTVRIRFTPYKDSVVVVLLLLPDYCFHLTHFYTDLIPPPRKLGFNPCLTVGWLAVLYQSYFRHSNETWENGEWAKEEPTKYWLQIWKNNLGD